MACGTKLVIQAHKKAWKYSILQKIASFWSEMMQFLVSFLTSLDLL